MELYKLKIPPVPYLLMTTSMVVLYTRSSHWKAGPMNQSASSTVCGRPCGITRTEEWHCLMNGASPEWEQLLSFSSISLSACHLCSEWPFVAWETLAGAQGFGLARWWCGTMAYTGEFLHGTGLALSPLAPVATQSLLTETKTSCSAKTSLSGML